MDRLAQKSVRKCVCVCVLQESSDFRIKLSEFRYCCPAPPMPPAATPLILKPGPASEKSVIYCMCPFQRFSLVWSGVGSRYQHFSELHRQFLHAARVENYHIMHCSSLDEVGIFTTIKSFDLENKPCINVISWLLEIFGLYIVNKRLFIYTPSCIPTKIKVINS